MKETINSMINDTLKTIDDYYEGKEDNYDKIELIINELHNYSKEMKMNIIKTITIVKISEFYTHLFFIDLLNTNKYQELNTQIKYNIDQLKSSYKILNRYLIVCKNNNQYPDLDVAYLLSINLSLLVANIMDHINLIRLYEKSIQSGYQIYNENNKTHQLNIDELTDILNDTIKNVR